MLKNKENVPKELSKLFNLVLNAEKINSPKKIGFCKLIYENYFKEFKKNPTFKGAVQYYKDSLDKNVEGGSQNIEIAKQELFSKSIDYMVKIKKIFTVKSFEREIAMNILNKNKDFYYCKLEFIAIEKTLHLFKKKNLKETLLSVERFINSLKKYNVFEIEYFARCYIENLVTYDSFIGTWVENDIKKFLAKKLNTSVKDSSKAEDKKGIDGWINGKALSIKSIKYKNSMYRRSRGVDITRIINGPIIFYKLDFNNPNSYEITNLNDILFHYSK